MNKFCLLLSFLSSFLFAGNYHVYEGVSDTSELFSTLNAVIGLLDQHDQGLSDGLEITFNKNGKYYEKSRGSNWWNYYFEPLQIGHKDKGSEKKIHNYEKRILSLTTQFEMAPERAHALINKYLKIKPDILEKVSQFRKENFVDGPVLGVYYNKSDAQLQPAISFEEVLATVQKKIDPSGKLFVVTREDKLLKLLKEHFNDVLVQFKESSSKKNKAQEAELELIESLLLSRCDSVIRTSNTFSKSITQFNPSLSVVDLDKSWQERD